MKNKERERERERERKREREKERDKEKENPQNFDLWILTGTFMIRLSERCAGGFAIAYVAQNPTSDNPDNRVIRHYLIQPDDVFGAKKTLPDFLGQARNFHYLVQIYTDPDGNRIYRQVNKDTFLGEYYSKRSFDNPYGYDSQLEVGMGNLTINSQPSTPFSNTPSSKQQ
jgi:hypothetical protein